MKGRRSPKDERLILLQRHSEQMKMSDCRWEIQRGAKAQK
jgi:hypothetical protein